MWVSGTSKARDRTHTRAREAKDGWWTRGLVLYSAMAAGLGSVLIGMQVWAYEVLGFGRWEAIAEITCELQWFQSRGKF
jgi:hypothetical protein